MLQVEDSARVGQGMQVDFHHQIPSISASKISKNFKHWSLGSKLPGSYLSHDFVTSLLRSSGLWLSLMVFDIFWYILIYFDIFWYIFWEILGGIRWNQNRRRCGPGCPSPGCCRCASCCWHCSLVETTVIPVGQLCLATSGDMRRQDCNGRCSLFGPTGKMPGFCDV